MTVRRAIFPAAEVPAREREGWRVVWPAHDHGARGEGMQVLMERRTAALERRLGTRAAEESQG